MPLMSSTDPSQLYDATAAHWVRRSPKLLSDFSARPRVLDAMGELSGLRVLDLGCGEGYMARLLLDQGVSEVVGLDLSREMISAAISSTTDERAIFAMCDLRQGLPPFKGTFDVVIAVFLFNYLTDAEVNVVMTQVASTLRPGGRVVVTIPHPALPFLSRSNLSREVFDFRPEHSYLNYENSFMHGHILDADGKQVEVLSISRTIESFLNAVDLRLWSLDHCSELGLTSQHAPECFSPLIGEPLHMLFTFTLKNIV